MIRKRLAILLALVVSVASIPMSPVTVLGADEIAVVSEDDGTMQEHEVEDVSVTKEDGLLSDDEGAFDDWKVMPVSFDGLTQEDCTSILVNEECTIAMQSGLFDHESVQGKDLQFNWALYKGISGNESSMKKFADLGDQRELTLKGEDLISAVNEMGSGENCLYIEAEILYNEILLASGGFDIQLTCDMSFGDTLLTKDFICVFEDEIRDVTIFSDIFDFVKDVDVKWELYSLDRETQSEELKWSLDEYWETGTSHDYVIEGARFKNLEGVYWDRDILRMRAAVCKGDYEFASREFTIDFYEKENYYYEDNTDISLIPGGEKLINGEIRGYVRDQYRPYGQKIFCKVTDVTVTTGEAVCYVYREGNDFKLVADNIGSAVVTVTYDDCYGEERTFDRIIHVNQDVLYLDVIWPYNSDCVLPYSTTEISTVLIHKWNYFDGEQGTEKIDDYEINLMTDEDGDYMYNQDLVEVSVLEDGKTLQVNAKDHLGESDIFINTEVQTDNDVSLFANANTRVNIVDRFCYSEDFDYNANAKVEETINICPSIKYRRIENGEIITEDFDGYFWFDMDYEREEFTVDEIEGGIAITRKCDNNISMNIRCWSVKDNETFEVFSKQINFNAVDHEWVINYEWSKDLSKCEAKAHCKYDGEIQTETVFSKKSLKKPATCKTDEILSYQATFENELFETQTKEVKGKKALGHTYVNNKCSRCSVYETLSTPTLIKAYNVSNGVKITWNAVNRAKKYNIYRKLGTGKWKKVGSSVKTTYIDKEAVLGKTYRYSVCCVANDGSNKEISSYNTTGLSTTRLATIKPTLSNYGKNIKIKWKKAAGAKGYVIWRKEGSGKYKKLVTIKKGGTVSYIDKKVKKGKTYTYYVYAYTDKATGAYVPKSIKKK